MKKMIAFALCGWLLCGCSRVDSDTNRIEDGTRRITDDVEDGINDIGDDLENGARDVEDGFEDMFEDDGNTADDSSAIDRSIADKIPSINRDPRLANIPSFRNATIGHPYSLSPSIN